MMNEQNELEQLRQENEQLKQELAELNNAYEKATENQVRLGEVTNNYLMLHYLIKNISTCRTSDQLWETYLHNITDRGFNYQDVYALIADESGELASKVSLEQKKLCKSEAKTFECDQAMIDQVCNELVSQTSSDNLAAAVPIINSSGQLKALLVVHKSTGIFFEDLELLDVYTQQTVATIENISLNEKLLRYQDLLGKRLDQFVLLHYITKQIHEAANYDEVLERYIDIITSPVGFNFQKCVLYLVDGQGPIKKMTGQGKEMITELWDQFEDQMLEKAYQTGQQQLNKEKSRLVYPLDYGQGKCVLIEIKNAQPILAEQQQMLEIFAWQTASVLHNLRLCKELEYLSYHDALTGLYSRAYFQQKRKEYEEQEIAPICLVLCDIDCLKKVNDTFGHEAGDRMIQAMAEILETSFPSEAIIARIGGDEFTVLVKEDQKKNIKAWQEKIDEKIMAYNAQSTDIQLGLSMGYAMSSVPISFDKLFRLADQRMYEDKEKRKTEY